MSVKQVRQVIGITKEDVEYVILVEMDVVSVMGDPYADNPDDYHGYIEITDYTVLEAIKGDCRGERKLDPEMLEPWLLREIEEQLDYGA